MRTLYKKHRRARKLFRYTLLLGGAAIFSLAAFSLVALATIFRNLPQPEDLIASRVNQSTKIYDRTGEILLYEIHGEEKRTIIPFEEIPEFVKQATLAIEDQNFYNHPAYDWRAILRSFIRNLLRLRLEQGGSTITQQLAKNAYLSPEKTISRKAKELLLAFRLEKQFTKDEILGLYLNQIPYGSNAYGVEAAAETYFKKSAKNLNLAEAALLAALPKAPTYYSPYGSNKDELLKRKDIVLKEMFQLGHINEKQFKDAGEYKFSFAPQATSIKAPHFVIAVQDYLVKKYGFETLEKGGLGVITTLDWNLQEAAEDIVERGVERNTKLYNGRNGALFAEDPKTGQVLAMVGSKDYFDVENEGNFNVAMQGLRQPGSAFKPFAYYTAFEKGYTPETVVFDLATEFDTTGILERSYKPGNFSRVFKGPISFRNALAQSVNIPAVKVIYLAGIDNVLKIAERFGISTLTERSRYGLSLVLGGGEVRLSELVHAYSVFANDGTKHAQTMILEVKNHKGEVLELYKDQAEEVGSPQHVRAINDILSDTNARAGLFGPGLLGMTIFPGHEVALKTGTTNNFVDVWAIGYTPGIVVGIWAGNNHREPLQESGGSITTGVPMWSEFMGKALLGKEPQLFPKPEPYLVSKPILKGDYLNQKQIHTILYYINKDDPRGPLPLRPEGDPQFWNWEIPVLNWAKKNVPDFDSYNKGIYTAEENSDTQITINSPQNGSFTSGELLLNFNVTAFKSGPKHIKIIWNGASLEEIQVETLPFSYQKTITVLEPELQNRLSIKVTDKSGAAFQKDIIVFK